MLNSFKNAIRNMIQTLRHKIADPDRDWHADLKKRNKVGLTVLSIILAASLAVGGISTFAEDTLVTDEAVTEGDIQTLAVSSADVEDAAVSNPASSDTVEVEGATSDADDTVSGVIGAVSDRTASVSGTSDTSASVSAAKLSTSSGNTAAVSDTQDTQAFDDADDVTDSGDEGGDVLTADGLSDDFADVETASDWEDTLPEELTGIWADDLITVAESQLGYHESTANYRVNSAGKHKGYTRYGAWYGDPYGDWCAMFVSFCLYYTDIPRDAFPEAASCLSWTRTLEKMELYEEADSGYEPVSGDLIFFNNNSNNDKPVDHVGIVTEVTEETDEDTGESLTIVHTIEGNSSDEVAEREYDITDTRIVGYGVLPENPDLEEDPDEGTIEDPDEDLVIDPVDTEHLQVYASGTGSDIFVLMTDSSDVETGDSITFIVQAYDALTDTWSPASGVKYVTMDGYTGGYDTEDCTATSETLTTRLNGQIVLTKTDLGYPYIHFTEDTVYANTADGTDGALRIVESSLGTDASWGKLTAYGKEGWSGTSLTLVNADTFYNTNNTSLSFSIEKELSDGASSDGSFTFFLERVVRASASPVTSMDQVLESAAGSNVSYTVYDKATDEEVRTGATTASGTFTLMAGQYAVFNVPEDSVWVTYEGINPGYTLQSLTANTDEAPNATIVDGVNAVVQNTHSVHATGTLILTLTDSDTGDPLEGGVFDLYKDGELLESGLTTDANGQIILEGCDPGTYYFKETKAPSGYTIPEDDTSDTVTVPEGLTKVTEYEVNMENVAKDYDVKYAVTLYGIQQDAYQKDDGSTGTAGLTFGPATGKSYLDTYDAHLTKEQYDAGEGICLHWMTWDEIIAQSEKDPTVFQTCLEEGCTHSVDIVLNDTLLATSYESQMDNGDGSGCLYSSIGSNYRKWNSSNYNTGGWPASQVRAVFNGKDGYLGSYAEYALDASDCLFSCFPSVLQEGIVAKAVKSDTVYNDKSGNNVTTYDKLWLFSDNELYGGFTLRKNEGELYQRSTLLGITTSNYGQLANYSEAGSARSWWLRSPSVNYSDHIFTVVQSGNWNNSNYANYTIRYGLAPGFCLPGPDTTVKYAVKVWGIQQDTYQKDDGSMGTAGLTFGPATGADHLNSYVSRETVGASAHPSTYCIHDMTWDEIIEQSATDPTVFADCKTNGCTKAVELEANSTLFNMSTVANASAQGYTGDGVSTLYYLLNGTGSSTYTYGAVWNCSYTYEDSTDPADIYSRSRIRATLTGDSADAKAQVVAGGEDYYDIATMCTESNCLLSCFPQELQDAVVPRETLNSGNAVESAPEVHFANMDSKTTYDKLFLFSVAETGGPQNYDDGGGSDYGVNNSNSDRKAYEYSNVNATGSSTQSWWSRSRHAAHTDGAIFINTSGSTYEGRAVIYALGLSPGFVLPGPVSSTGLVTFTLTDSDDGTPLSGGTFDLYKDGRVIQRGLVTDENGQIIVTGCEPGAYYFKETEAPSVYTIPEDDTSDTVTVPEGPTKVTEYEVNMENAAKGYNVK